MECNTVNWLNFIVTAILSVLLIILTFRLGRKQNQISDEQNKLQERISNDQNQLQKLIAEKDVKVSMYQHRMNCYMQVMQALDIIIYAKLEDSLEVFNSGNVVNILRKISEGRNLLFKSLVESEPLFSQEVVNHVGDMYRQYDKLYGIFCGILMISNEEFNKRRLLLLIQIGATVSDSDANILLKYNTPQN